MLLPFLGIVIAFIVNHSAPGPTPQASARTAGGLDDVRAPLQSPEEALRSAAERYARDLRSARLRNDERAIVYALLNLAGTHLRLGEATLAQQRYEEALTLVAGSDNRGQHAAVLNGLGATALARGGVGLALEHHRQALRLAQRGGDEGQYAAGLSGIAEAYRRAGDAEGAVVYWEELARQTEAQNDDVARAYVLVELGVARQAADRPVQARQALAEAAALADALWYGELKQRAEEALEALEPG
ncbi:MAG: tetratricopeptide repeat protein [Pseudomonadota bacterium]